LLINRVLSPCIPVVEVVVYIFESAKLKNNDDILAN